MDLEAEKKRQIAALRARERLEDKEPARSAADVVARAGGPEIREVLQQVTDEKHAVALLVGLTVTPQEAEKLVAAHGVEAVRRAVLLLADSVKAGQVIANRPGWLVQAIRENYAGERERAAAQATARVRPGRRRRLVGAVVLDEGGGLAFPPGDAETAASDRAVMTAAGRLAEDLAKRFLAPAGRPRACPAEGTT